jgi:hypothetical protein
LETQNFEAQNVCTKLITNCSISSIFFIFSLERIIASKWIKKFLACDPSDYKHNLSLFISSLTKQILVEPFNLAPQDSSNQWQDFSQEYTTADINRAVNERLYKDALTPSYQVEISQDLQEYIAFQEIPLFGAHFYYAFSPVQKINQWQKFGNLKVPKKITQVLNRLGQMQEEEPESPIKGRISSKPKDRAKGRGPTKSTTMPKPKAKPQKPTPQWEGGVEEEPEPEPEVTKKKPMISIPTDIPLKSIPPALQRRMAEAEKKSKFVVVSYFLNFSQVFSKLSLSF